MRREEFVIDDPKRVQLDVMALTEEVLSPWQAEDALGSLSIFFLLFELFSNCMIPLLFPLAFLDR